MGAENHRLEALVSALPLMARLNIQFVYTDELLRQFAPLRPTRSCVSVGSSSRGLDVSGEVAKSAAQQQRVRDQPDEFEAQPHVYIPLAQDAGWDATLIVRAR